MCRYKCHRRGQRNLSNRTNQDAHHIHRNAERQVEAISAMHPDRRNEDTKANTSDETAPTYNKDSKIRRRNKVNKAYPCHSIHGLHNDRAHPSHYLYLDRILRKGKGNHQYHNFSGHKTHTRMYYLLASTNSLEGNDKHRVRYLLAPEHQSLETAENAWKKNRQHSPLSHTENRRNLRPL